MTPDMDDAEDRVIAQHSKSMGYLLARAHGLFREFMARALDGSGLHMGHLVVVASLHARNDLTQAQLAQISGIEKSSIVLFLDHLEAGGWVERRRHPSDRRAHLVHLTEDGRRRFAPVGVKLYAAQEQALGIFSPEERGRFEGNLRRLIAHLETGGEAQP